MFEKSEVAEIRVNFTVFDLASEGNPRETTLDSNHREVREIEGSKNRDYIRLYVCWDAHYGIKTSELRT